MGRAFKPIALVVEDDPDQRELLTLLLEESELHVFSCESAEAALRILDKIRLRHIADRDRRAACRRADGR